MTKQFKSVSLMLCLLAMSTGFAMATTSAAPISAPVVQQSETATGTVVDAMGPVIGASVVVKGTTNGVITDFDGNFSLSNVKKGDVIQISFVGYATQEIVWDGKVMNVTLKEDAEMLEEEYKPGTYVLVVWGAANGGVNSKVATCTFELGASQGVEQVASKTNAMKQVVDGQLVIMKNGVKYNAIGSVIK